MHGEKNPANHTGGVRHFAATRYVTAKVCVLILGHLSIHKNSEALSQAIRRTHGGEKGMAFVTSHQNLGSCVRQAQPHESSTHEHGGSQQDGDCFGDADQGAKY